MDFFFGVMCARIHYYHCQILPLYSFCGCWDALLPPLWLAKKMSGLAPQPSWQVQGQFPVAQTLINLHWPRMLSWCPCLWSGFPPMIRALIWDIVCKVFQQIILNNGCNSWSVTLHARCGIDHVTKQTALWTVVAHYISDYGPRMKKINKLGFICYL